MGGFPVTQFYFQLMDAVLHGCQFFEMRTKPVSIGEAFIELGDMVAEDSDFLLEDLLSLLSGSVCLLSRAEFVHLCRKTAIKLADPAVTLEERVLKLLDHIPMGGFPITERNLQLMDTVMAGFQLFHLGTKPVSIGEAFIELSDVLS